MNGVITLTAHPFSSSSERFSIWYSCGGFISNIFGSMGSPISSKTENSNTVLLFPYSIFSSIAFITLAPTSESMSAAAQIVQRGAPSQVSEFTNNPNLDISSVNLIFMLVFRACTTLTSIVLTIVYKALFKTVSFDGSCAFRYFSNIFTTALLSVTIVMGC